MTSRLHTQTTNTRKQTPAFSTAPAQGMFQSRPFEVRSPSATKSQQQPDLKTSLTQAERYGHYLGRMQPAGVSAPKAVQPKMVKDPVIQCMGQKRPGGFTSTNTEEQNKRQRQEYVGTLSQVGYDGQAANFAANRAAIAAQAPNLLAGQQQRQQQRANFEANRTQVAPSLNQAYGNREATLNRVLNTLPGHGHVMHGAGTTLGEQYQRVETGRNPAIARPTMGNYGNPAWTAGRFNQHAGEYQAVTDAYRYVAQNNPAPNQPGDRLSVVVGGPQGGGQGYRYNQPNNTINPINQRNAQVVLQWNPGTGTYAPITQYPTNNGAMY